VSFVGHKITYLLNLHFLTFSELLEEADCQLFSRTVCTNHCLHHLLQPDKSELSMSLRPRGHSFDLPRYRYDLTRKSFVFRNLVLTGINCTAC